MKQEITGKNNELNVETENEQFNQSQELQQLYKKLESIENVINNLDTSYLNHLNKKINDLLSVKTISKYIFPIVFLIIILAAIFLVPCSPVYQKTRQQRLLNDILERHYTELCVENDAIKAVEQCKKILEEWNMNQATVKEDIHENE